MRAQSQPADGFDIPCRPLSLSQRSALEACILKSGIARPRLQTPPPLSDPPPRVDGVDPKVVPDAVDRRVAWCSPDGRAERVLQHARLFTNLVLTARLPARRVARGTRAASAPPQLVAPKVSTTAAIAVGLSALLNTPFFAIFFVLVLQAAWRACLQLNWVLGSATLRPGQGLCVPTGLSLAFLICSAPRGVVKSG